MAKTSKKETDKKTESTEKTPFWKLSRQQKMLFGSLLVLFSIALLVSFISFFFFFHQDESTLT